MKMMAMPVECWSSRRSSTMRRWTTGSRAEVISSQMSARGPAAMARAMAARWISPPESCAGRRRAKAGSSWTCRSSSSRRAAAAGLEREWMRRRTRVMEWPMPRAGLKAAARCCGISWIAARSAGPRPERPGESPRPSSRMRPAAGRWRPEGAAGQVEEGLAAEADGSGLALHAGAGFADQREHAPGFEFERGPAQDFAAAVGADAEFADGDQRGHAEARRAKRSARRLAGTVSRRIMSAGATAAQALRAAPSMLAAIIEPQSTAGGGGEKPRKPAAATR